MTAETELSKVYTEAASLVIELSNERTELALKVKELESENERLKRELEFYKRNKVERSLKR